MESQYVFLVTVMCLDNKKLSVLDWDMITNPWMYCRTPEKQHKKPHKEGSMFHDFCLRERFRWGSCSSIPFLFLGFWMSLTGMTCKFFEDGLSLAC